MARYTITTEGEEALAAATAETILQLRGATTTKAKLIEIGVSFDGTSPTAEPVRIRVLRQTTDGTATGASEEKDDPDDPTAGCTGFHSFTAEPTAGGVLRDFELHPAGLPFVLQWPLGREPVLDDATTSRVGIECTAPAVVNATGWITWEE